LLAGCSGDQEATSGPDASDPTLLVSDGARGGFPRVYFLPPLVPNPSVQGTPTNAFLDQLRIDVCDTGTGVPVVGTSCLGKPIIASFTRSGGTAGATISYDESGGLYKVNWNTDLSVGGDIKLDHYYRVQVWLGGPLLVAFADLDQVRNGTELKNVSTGTSIPLLSGRTLPIKVRLEQGAAAPLGSGGGTASLAGGAVELTVPAGTLQSDISLIATNVPATAYPTDLELISGTVHDFFPSPFAFASPVTLTLHYSESSLPSGTPETALVLYHEVNGSWVQVAGSGPDVARNTVSGPISNFSRYGIGRGRIPPLTVVRNFQSIIQYNADGTGQSVLVPAGRLTNIFNNAVAWAPDGKTLAFVADEIGCCHFGVYTVDADGSNLTRITNLDRTGLDLDLRWTPDGTNLVVLGIGEAASAATLRIVDVSGTISSVLPLSEGSLGNGFDVSPDGGRVAFVQITTPASFAFRIMVWDLGAGTVTPITPVYPASGAVDGVRWSPTGSRIAFHSSKDDLVAPSNSDLYTIAPDGTNEVRLTTTPDEDEFGPAWSPDGMTLAYNYLNGSFSPGSAAIRVVPASGGASHLLGPGTLLGANAPAWSPEGQLIAYTAFNGTAQVVMVSAADNSSTTVFSNGTPSGIAWRP
jgi:Tol biopolymer transport system component